MQLAKQEQTAKFQPFLKASIFWTLEATLKMHHLEPKWDWPNWDVAETYQLVPKWVWTIWEVKRPYQLIVKRDWLILVVEKTHQLVPKRD